TRRTAFSCPLLFSRPMQRWVMSNRCQVSGVRCQVNNLLHECLLTFALSPCPLVSPAPHLPYLPFPNSEF
ncbi:MAG: hypothetical protein ACRDEA_03850, partial [Microcystaceae cyanobacterium]